MKQETKLVKDFLHGLGYTGIKVNAHKDMASDMLKGVVYVNKKQLYHMDEDFKHIKKLYAKKGWHIKVSVNTFTILHELGHVLSAKTLKNVEKELMAYQQQVNILSMANLPRSLEVERYRKLKLERMADNFAYVIYLLHEKEVIAFDKKLKKVLKNEF